MEAKGLDPKLPLLQDADLKGKVVLVRFDHNVVKKGVINDPFRIERSLPTLIHLLALGAHPVLMTHVGRPKDKKSGAISCDPSTDVAAIVDYLEAKTRCRFLRPTLTPSGDQGIVSFADQLRPLVDRVRAGQAQGIYLPNTRWFAGEEAKDQAREDFASQLAGLADLYVNDAFGSWQPHATTFDLAQKLPSYAGFLMQDELVNLGMVLQPQRPYLGVVAGSKYDTKIGPLRGLYEQSDHLILGGVIYNTYLCAKYGVKIAGVGAEDIALARELVQADQKAGKILEMPHLVESDVLGREEGKFRPVGVADFREGQELGYILDVQPRSFAEAPVAQAIGGAGTIFVNAVMGFTPHFGEGTAALFQALARNQTAMKLYGGGDTLQDFMTFAPGTYLKALHDPRYYFFTGGGAVLKAIEQRSPYGLKPVAALMGQG